MGSPKCEFPQHKGIQCRTICWPFFLVLASFKKNVCHVVHFSIFPFFMFSMFRVFSRVAFYIFPCFPDTCHLRCGADATFAFERPCKRKPHLPRSGKLGPHTDLNRPCPSPSKIKSFGVHQKLTQQTPVPAVVRSGQVRSGQVRSGQVRSGQVRSGHVTSGTLTRAKAQEEKERKRGGRKTRIKILGLKLSIKV